MCVNVLSSRHFKTKKDSIKQLDFLAFLMWGENSRWSHLKALHWCAFSHLGLRILKTSDSLLVWMLDIYITYNVLVDECSMSFCYCLVFPVRVLCPCCPVLSPDFFAQKWENMIPWTTHPCRTHIFDVVTAKYMLKLSFTFINLNGYWQMKWNEMF